MRFTRCPICAYAHDPAGQCPPGRRRRYEIEFPAHVKSTPCQTYRHTLVAHTRHGMVKVQATRLTPHGHYLAAMQRAER